jgi:hypothetical protein
MAEKARILWVFSLIKKVIKTFVKVQKLGG